MRAIRRGVNICCAALFIASVSFLPVHADNLPSQAYQTTNQLKLSSQTKNHGDLQFRYGEIINGTGNWNTLYFTDNNIANETQIQEFRNNWNNQKQRWSLSNECQAANLATCYIRIHWTTDTSLGLEWGSGSVGLTGSSAHRYSTTIVANPSGGDQVWVYFGTGFGAGSYGRTLISWHDLTEVKIWNYLVFVDETKLNYPIDYNGEMIEDGSTVDSDNDGLSLLQEMQQGTSDGNVDTDGDGISDFKESVWFLDRDEVFCDTTTSPYTCAYPDPVVKDLYVEIDWMQSLSRNLKPNATQLGWAVSGLGGNDYNIHVDTGEYGGGNMLPYITDLPFLPDATEVDYFDLKDGNSSSSISANFNPKRKGIWRYVMVGYNFAEHPESSGGSLAGSENVFISYGMIEDNQPRYGYMIFDMAIAGTIIHELGHSLCLSNTQSYTFQSSDCQFAGIDDYDTSLTYDSVMNYSLQMFVNRLSHGENGSGDHDDWSAINEGGIADFSRWTIGDSIDSGLGEIYAGITMRQAEKAKRSGTLGKVRYGDEIYDYRAGKVYNAKTGKTRMLGASQ